MVIVGIDPGVSGAISILREGKITMICDMPIMIDGTKSKRQINAAELAIEAGAEECISYDEFHVIHTEMEEIYEIKKKLEKNINNFISTNIEWVPINYVNVSNEKKELLNDFFDALDDDDDVQNFYTNIK